MTAPTGFPPGIVNGNQYVGSGSAPAVNAHANFSTAYTQAKALATTDERSGLADITGLTLTPGVYNFNGALTLQGTVYLAGAGDYVFKIASARKCYPPYQPTVVISLSRQHLLTSQ